MSALRTASAMTVDMPATQAANQAGAGPLRTRALRAWQHLEHGVDAVFGAAANPLRHLGALGFLFFWWLAASGIYLFAVLDSSATAAFESIAGLARQPWYAGGWLRSVHRYAADAFVAAMLAHLMREWVLGRYQGFRRFSWLTGVPLLLFGFGSGIVGFWLNWDRLGQFSAMATAEWLDALPLFGSPLARNFINTAAVNDRLFSLFIFIHVGVPLLMLFGLWFHIQRLTRAAVFPPRGLALASTLGLLALAVLAPVASQGPADLSSAPGPLAFDWFLLFVHPLVDATSANIVWALLAAAVLILLGLPFLPQPAPAPVARVDPANCNGCCRCFVDCPYAAVTMVPHPDWQTPGRPIRQLAQVNADLCAGCGICVGACPSSTPFRSSAKLITGIDMPQQPLDAVRRQVEAGLAALHAEHRFVVIGCDQGLPVARHAAADVTTLSLVCTGMLPPAFVEYALRGGAAGVVVTGCRDGDCAFRFGQHWTDERLRGEREPHLRASVPRERLRVVWPTTGDAAAVSRALSELRHEAVRATASNVETLTHG
jgi:coenzyme F420-reducing hydrogenase delta subunit/Fe-S-cluster-containing hydrogenase component 2